MGYWSRIQSRDDALRVIENSAMLFFALAAMQVVAAVFLVVSASQRGLAYFSASPEVILNYVATAGIILALAAWMRTKQSRVAAVSLLLISAAIAANSIYTAANGTQPPSGNTILAGLAIIFALRATYATFKAQGQFGDTADGAPVAAAVPPKAPSPETDFISHPGAGVESAAATAARRRPPPSYDRQKWAVLLKYDDEIAIVAKRIRRLGAEWEDELAHAYLALNDKSYLARIENKIYADARAERVRSRL